MRRLLAIFSPGRVLLVATIIAGIYLTVSAGDSVLHSYKVAGNESRLREEIAELKVKQDQLIQIRDYLRSDEYVEFMARRVFGLVKPGEKLVNVKAPTPEAQSAVQGEEQQRSLTWWERLFVQH